MVENMVALNIEMVDAKTPTKDEAKRGDFSDVCLIETSEQLSNNLIWDKCSFCGGYVLIITLPMDRTREKCKCGAKRISRYIWRNGEPIAYQDGWRKDGVEWTTLD